MHACQLYAGRLQERDSAHVNNAITFKVAHAATERLLRCEGSVLQQPNLNVASSSTSCLSVYQKITLQQLAGQLHTSSLQRFAVLYAHPPQSSRTREDRGYAGWSALCSSRPLPAAISIRRQSVPCVHVYFCCSSL